MRIFILTLFILIAIIQPIYTFSSANLVDFENRWAFLVSVGQYPSESSIGQLNSPADDVKAIKQMLIQYGGFSPEHIIILSEHQATYLGVNEAFQRLANQVQPEDLVLFYFSGRGSRVVDDVFIDSERDKLDECFLLYDTVLEDGTPISNYIRDDEIGRHLKQLDSKRCVVIIDACYQGNNADEKGVTANPTASDSSAYDGMSGDFLPPGTIILEACAPNETTIDGVFTSLLTELVTSVENSDGIITMEEFHSYSANRLSQQKPQLLDPELRAAQVSLLHPILEVISQPPGATIFVNDEERGTTPKQLVLPIARHELKLRKRGYRIWDNDGSLIEITQMGIQTLIDGIIELKPVKVMGEVKFRNSNMPVPGATVMIAGAGSISPVTTDADGRFTFEDWSQDDLSDSSEYEIKISGEGVRHETKNPIPKEKLADFTNDISLGTIIVNRQITVTVTVTNPANISMLNAKVQLDQQQITYDNRDEVFNHFIINPSDSVTLQVSQEGYEVYQETITIEPRIHKYSRQVKLTPALNTYSVEVTNQFKETVDGFTVILNDEQLGEVTNSDGIAEGQRLLAPDETMSIQLQKDGYEFPVRSVRPERLEYNRYRLPIQSDVIRISLFAVDEGNIPVKGVQINIDDQYTAATDAKGEAVISVYRPPNTEISLDVIYESIEYQITKPTTLQALEGGGFKILKPGFVEPFGVNNLKIGLPIPPEVTLSVIIREQNNEPIPEMTVKVNDKTYGKTDSTGKIDIRARIVIVDNEPPNFEFEKYGEPYKPQKTEFAISGTNAYTALVTLQIPYGNIELTADTEVEDKEMEKRKINLYVNVEVLLDDGEIQALRLPVIIPVLPGIHQLRILISGVLLRNEQLLKIPKNETIPINLTFPLFNAWHACVLTLSERPNDVGVLQSALEVAETMGQNDLAETFRKRKERLLK